MCLQWTVFYSIHLLYNKITVLVPIYKVLKSIRSRFKEKSSNYRLLFILHKACHFTKKKCTSRLNALYSVHVFPEVSKKPKCFWMEVVWHKSVVWKISLCCTNGKMETFQVTIIFLLLEAIHKIRWQILTIFDSLPPSLISLLLKKAYVNSIVGIWLIFPLPHDCQRI